jgi:hypothetical protein
LKVPFIEKFRKDKWFGWTWDAFPWTRWIEHFGTMYGFWRILEEDRVFLTLRLWFEEDADFTLESFLVEM